MNSPAGSDDPPPKSIVALDRNLPPALFVPRRIASTAELDRRFFPGERRPEGRHLVPITAASAAQTGDDPPSRARPLGRPSGKRSDPAWKQFSVLLKRDTQREAAAILHAKDEGLDLSGLVQSLLENWIKR